MNQAEYLEQRLEDQIGWYELKSGEAQAKFKTARLCELVAAATIPFLAGIATLTTLAPLQWLIAVLAIVVAVAAGAAELSGWQVNWMNYRRTAEALKHEKFAYLTKVGPYDSGDAFDLLVERVEGLISTEHSKWLESRDNMKGGAHG